MTHLHRCPAEPAPVQPAGAGSPSSETLAAALEVALEWAATPRAVLLSGSHAAGEAVWARHQGRAVSLSDVDLYFVLEDDAACRAARARQRAAMGGLSRRCLGFGLAAPLEAGFHTPAGLSRLPARPGVIELARHGRVIRGDARVADLVPRHRPGDVSAEEIALLLENRGCELLWCRPRLASADRLERLAARHALLKCALDLAGVASLLAGEYPDGARLRVAWAREHRRAPRDAAEEQEARALDRLWDAAIAWREGAVEPLDPAAGEAEWRIAVSGWVRAWWETGERVAPGAPAEPVARALALARRARVRRRFREALSGSGGRGPGRVSLVARAAGGTLRHRVHASAALLLLEAGAGGARALPAATGAAIERLGVVPGAASPTWEGARRAVVEAWDRWLLDGQRTADPA